MIPRYSNPEIDYLWSDAEKLLRWERVELAVIKARVNLKLTDASVYNQIELALANNAPDVAWWLERDRVLHHDLNAFLEERQRFIPNELQSEFHKDMTSYDTEEAAFAIALRESHEYVDNELSALLESLEKMAKDYRYTIFLERTHGQAAKLRTFGGRLLTYVADLQLARDQLKVGVGYCMQSRLSGAIGNYGGGLTPRIEKEALNILGLSAYVGATQIMPRSIYAPLAQSLQVLCETLGKIALDIRLGARSGQPLWHEPFGKLQKGSSAMPHKKNTIRTEQMRGMVLLARGRVASIVAGIQTWEARAIEQSCVERVDWPDLFHITLRMLNVMTEVLTKLVVYPDNMLEEIQASRCTYASDEAKNFLAGKLAERALPANEAYRIVQLASFCAFEPGPARQELREARAESLEKADAFLTSFELVPTVPTSTNLRDIISSGLLYPVDSLQASVDDIIPWNLLLKDLFKDESVMNEWNNLFRPSHLLQQETSIFNHFLDT
ncbi:MAG: lyase family protein [Patescibacteria group bacterium]